MKLQFEFNGSWFRIDTASATSIAMGLEIHGGRQPGYFGAPAARGDALQLGDFIGDTTRGGSCNVEKVELIPHCNGTHTETVGHIVDDQVDVGTAHVCGLMTATLITVQPSAAAQVNNESCRPEANEDDQVITAFEIGERLRNVADWATTTDALIVRTQDNGPDRASREYGDDFQPAYFTTQAIELIREAPFSHLLTDLPSIDRMRDDGLLTNHHIFWNVPERTHRLVNGSFRERTITEMIDVPAVLADGLYLLNLQVPAFCSDAAPSRPVLFELEVSDA